MTATPSNSRETNNLGFLRLFFAALVILSHSPELIDGNRSRELLTRLFGTISFGELAVDGFFLISGYLILQSFINSGTYVEYLAKRVLRIYPGYIVAFGVSLLIGALVGGRLSGPLQILRLVGGVLFLRPPNLDGAFAGLPNGLLNGAMWTIAYEFRCYLLVILLGALGVLKDRRVYLVFTVALLFGMLSQMGFRLPPMVEKFTGDVRWSIHFCFIFCAGGVFYLFRDRIRYTQKAAIIALAALFPFMFLHRFVEAALATLGGYFLFWFAFQVKSSRLGRIGNGIDLSYGLYLYAWPIQTVLIWHYRHISPWILFGISTVTAGAVAWVSWTLIERPFLSLKSRWRRRSPAASGIAKLASLRPQPPTSRPSSSTHTEPTP
jgi:peptidoglycan/LPS O-acetylase OafA/YrhL